VGCTWRCGGADGEAGGDECGGGEEFDEGLQVPCVEDSRGDKEGFGRGQDGDRYIK